MLCTVCARGQASAMGGGQGGCPFSIVSQSSCDQPNRYPRSAGNCPSHPHPRPMTRRRDQDSGRRSQRRTATSDAQATCDMHGAGKEHGTEATLETRGGTILEPWDGEAEMPLAPADRRRCYEARGRLPESVPQGLPKQHLHKLVPPPPARLFQKSGLAVRTPRRDGSDGTSGCNKQLNTLKGRAAARPCRIKLITQQICQNIGGLSCSRDWADVQKERNAN